MGLQVPQRKAPSEGSPLQCPKEEGDSANQRGRRDNPEDGAKGQPGTSAESSSSRVLSAVQLEESVPAHGAPREPGAAIAFHPATKSNCDTINPDSEQNL